MSINKNFSAFTLRTHKSRAFAAGIAALCTVAIGAGFMSYFDYKDTSAPGWHEGANGSYYIVRSTGDRAVGLKLIDNSTYLFDTNGFMKKGWQNYDGNTYYFDPDSGVMQKGLVEIPVKQDDGTMKDEEFWFSNESGIFRTGLQDFNGQQYYFNEHGKPETGFTKNGEYYYDKNGQRMKGWQTINDVEYYFFESGKKEGKMAKGWTDIKDEETGKTFTYYFGADGHKYTGVNVIRGAVYDFQKSGRLFKGWNKHGKYYIHADEETGEFARGLTKIGDDYFFFDSDFHMVTGWYIIEGNKYRFDDDGKMMHGCWYEENLKKYYFNEDGTAAIGFIKQGYDYYFFAPEDNRLLKGWQNYDDNWYFSDEDGKVWQGFYMFKGHWWFFDQVTHRAATGLTQTITPTKEETQRIEKFKKDLENLTKLGQVKEQLGLPDLPPESSDEYDAASVDFINGLIVNGGYTQKQAKYCEKLWNKYETADSYDYLNAAAYSKIGDRLFGQHFFGDDHACKTGFQTFEGIRFYFDPVTGEKATGWKTLGGKKYYFGDFGVCAVGKVRIDGKLYDFGTKGHLPSGVAKVGGSYKYVISEGNYGKNVFGRDSSGKVYYFDYSGNTLSGWQTVNGVLFLFGANGDIQTGWQKYGNSKVYISEEGAMRSSWMTKDDETYYFDENYQTVTGWNEIGGMWYYFDSSGKVKNGWTVIDGKQYYLDHGTPVRGVFTPPGETRPFVIGAQGYLVAGWVSFNNNLYYSDEEGRPLTNVNRSIDGAFYSFDINGVATRLG